MQRDFNEVMRVRTNEQLIEITTILRADYVPEALTAAEEELASRGLSEQEYKLAESSVEIKRVKEKEIETEPLQTSWKVQAMVLPFFLPVLIVFLVMRADGYKKRSKDYIMWNLYGLGMYIAIFMLIYLIGLIM